MMHLLAVMVEINGQTLWDAAQLAGPVVALLAAFFLMAKHFRTLKGLLAKIPMPGGETLVDDAKAAADPRVCMMHDWDHFQAELLANGADAGEVEAFSNETVWPTIQKAPKGLQGQGVRGTIANKQAANAAIDKLRGNQ